MSVLVLSTRAKLMASAAIVAAAAGAAGLGTFGSFTSTTSASATVSSGTVVIGLSNPSVGSSLSVNATNIVPGDVVNRVVNVNNTGNQDLSTLTLTTTATTTSKLDTDATNGLQLSIQKCSSAWTAAYTCGGSATTLVASRAVIGSNLSLTGASALTAGGTDNLLVTMTLPSTADNTFQGLASTVNFTFTGTQRAATTTK
jgi:spore coat-associated protein N